MDYKEDIFKIIPASKPIGKIIKVTYEVEVNCFGRKTEKGNFLWNIPSLDLWFQTKEDTEIESLIPKNIKQFIDFYTENITIQDFIQRLQKLGWNISGEHISIIKKRSGFRNKTERYFDPSKTIVSTRNKSEKDYRIEGRLNIQKRSNFEVSQASSF